MSSESNQSTGICVLHHTQFEESNACVQELVAISEELIRQSKLRQSEELRERMRIEAQAWLRLAVIANRGRR